MSTFEETHSRGSGKHQVYVAINIKSPPFVNFISWCFSNMVNPTHVRGHSAHNQYITSICVSSVRSGVTGMSSSVLIREACATAITAVFAEFNKT